MSEEILAGVDPAKEPPAVTTESSVPNQTDDTTEEADDDGRTFTQTELDDIIRKRLGKEQRKMQREFEQRIVQANRPRPADVRPENYRNVDDYADALAEQKAERLLAHRDAQKQYEDITHTYVEKEETAREKYDDFEQVAYNPNLRISDVMADVIKSADNGPDIAYYLGSNPKEADRIFKLPQAIQAKEIGKLEAKLSNDPPTKRTSNAPAPITPVNARKSGSSAYSTTDPRSITAMSTEDWIVAERRRQIKAMEAKRLR